MTSPHMLRMFSTIPTFVCQHRDWTNVSSVPEAEVNLEIMKVCFGDVVYQGEIESGAAYFDRRAERA